MDAAANLIFGKDFAQQCLIPNIALVEFDRFAGQFLNALQTLRIGVAQIIDDDNTIVAIQQLDAGMGTNIAGISSRNSTPLWAREISPGLGLEPPPASPALDTV